MKLFRVLRRLVRVLLAAILALLVGGLAGRFTVLLLAAASLTALAVLRHRRPLWIPWMWTAAIGLGFGLARAPVDVRIDPYFTPGVWVRPVVYGLLGGPIPLDAKGVPEAWPGGCIVLPNSPETVIVVGL
jgi:hypothetical protein